MGRKFVAVRMWLTVTDSEEVSDFGRGELEKALRAILGRFIYGGIPLDDLADDSDDVCKMIKDVSIELCEEENGVAKCKRSKVKRLFRRVCSATATQ